MKLISDQPFFLQLDRLSCSNSCTLPWWTKPTNISCLHHNKETTELGTKEDDSWPISGLAFTQEENLN